MNALRRPLRILLLATGMLLWHTATSIAWKAPFRSWVSRASSVLSEPPQNAAATADGSNPGATAPGHQMTSPAPTHATPTRSAQPKPAAETPKTVAQPGLSESAPSAPESAAQAPVQDWGYGVMHGWDLYAGSVYANTSPLWFQAEYVLMWTSGTRMPALLTTSPNGTPASQAGVVGQPGTQVLFGNQLMSDDARSGIRATLGVRLGHWFDYFMNAELEGHLLYLGNPGPNGDFHGSSTGDPILARPFYNASINAEDAQLLAYPGVSEGGIDIDTSSQFLSAGVLFRRGWRCGSWGRVDWLAGYRYIKFEDELQATGKLVTTDPNGAYPVGTFIQSADYFKAWNEFNGGELGLQFWTDYHGWTMDVVAKLALGSMSRIVDVQGSTLIDQPGAVPVWTSGGLLAQPTNLARHRSTYFSTVPELGIRFRHRLSHSFVFTFGYTLILVDHVVRVGEQVDRVINPTQIGGNPLVGPARPRVPMTDRTLWVQGLTFGLEW